MTESQNGWDEGKPEVRFTMDKKTLLKAAKDAASVVSCHNSGPYFLRISTATKGPNKYGVTIETSSTTDKVTFFSGAYTAAHIERDISREESIIVRADDLISILDIAQSNKIIFSTLSASKLHGDETIFTKKLILQGIDYQEEFEIGADEPSPWLDRFNWGAVMAEQPHMMYVNCSDFKRAAQNVLKIKPDGYDPKKYVKCVLFNREGSKIKLVSTNGSSLHVEEINGNNQSGIIPKRRVEYEERHSLRYVSSSCAVHRNFLRSIEKTIPKNDKGTISILVLKSGIGFVKVSMDERGKMDNTPRISFDKDGTDSVEIIYQSFNEYENYPDYMKVMEFSDDPEFRAIRVDRKEILTAVKDLKKVFARGSAPEAVFTFRSDKLVITAIDHSNGRKASRSLITNTRCSLDKFRTLREQDCSTEQMFNLKLVIPALEVTGDGEDIVLFVRRFVGIEEMDAEARAAAGIKNKKDACYRENVTPMMIHTTIPTNDLGLMKNGRRPGKMYDNMGGYTPFTRYGASLIMPVKF